MDTMARWTPSRVRGGQGKGKGSDNLKDIIVTEVILDFMDRVLRMSVTEVFDASSFRDFAMFHTLLNLDKPGCVIGIGTALVQLRVGIMDLISYNGDSDGRLTMWLDNLPRSADHWLQLREDFYDSGSDSDVGSDNETTTEKKEAEQDPSIHLHVRVPVPSNRCPAVGMACLPDSEACHGGKDDGKVDMVADKAEQIHSAHLFVHMPVPSSSSPADGMVRSRDSEAHHGGKDEEIVDMVDGAMFYFIDDDEEEFDDGYDFITAAFETFNKKRHESDKAGGRDLKYNDGVKFIKQFEGPTSRRHESDIAGGHERKHDDGDFLIKQFEGIDFNEDVSKDKARMNAVSAGLPYAASETRYLVS